MLYFPPLDTIQIPDDIFTYAINSSESAGINSLWKQKTYALGSAS